MPKVTPLIARNINLKDKRTSIRLEKHMWAALKEIAKREKCTIHQVCWIVNDRRNGRTTLTASIRVFIMLYFKAASTEAGHKKVGHGSYLKMITRIENYSPPSTHNETESIQSLKNENIPSTGKVP